MGAGGVGKGVGEEMKSGADIWGATVVPYIYSILYSPIWCRVQYPTCRVLDPDRRSHLPMSIYTSNQDLAATSST